MEIISQRKKVYPVISFSKDEDLEIAERNFVEDIDITNNEIYLRASGDATMGEPSNQLHIESPENRRYATA